MEQMIQEIEKLIQKQINDNSHLSASNKHAHYVSGVISGLKVAQSVIRNNSKEMK